MMRALTVSLFVISLAAPATAAPILSAEGPDAAIPFKLWLDGSYRISAQTLSDLRLDSDGSGIADADDELYGQGHMVTHRLRFTPAFEVFTGVRFDMDLQLGTGFLSVENPNDRYAEYGPPRSDSFAAGEQFGDQIKLRKLYMTWRMPIGAIVMGRMASNWGAGILANGGDDDTQDWGAARFGLDRNYGDVVNRVMFATAPFLLGSKAPWAQRTRLVIGGDIVERDERLSREDGDDARQFVTALRYADETNEAGVYVAYRDLEDRNYNTMTVWAFDLYGKGSWRFGDLEAYGMGEIAFATGETTWGQSSAFTDELAVRQLGYVARVGATWLPLNVGGDIELGYASGDANPVDGNLRNFSFDPDYNPSLILFEELRAAETVAAQANASDPSRVGYPPDGARFLPTNGSVTNAIYVRPTVRYQWQDLTARVALLWARAEESVIDPYNLNAYSVRRNFQGGDADAKDLGLEIDVGVDYKYRFDDWVAATVGLQAGRLMPGEAFANEAGDKHPAINVVFARLLVHWLPPEPAE